MTFFLMDHLFSITDAGRAEMFGGFGISATMPPDGTQLTLRASHSKKPAWSILAM
jgi:hypothetical protein